MTLPEQESMALAKKFLEDRVVLCCNELMSAISNHPEVATDDYEDEWCQLHCVPDLINTREALIHDPDIWLADPDDDLENLSLSEDYVALEVSDSVELAADTEAEALLEYFDNYLNLDDVIDPDETFPLSDEYIESNEFRYGTIVPAVTYYLDEHGSYLVRYGEIYYVIDSFEELASGETEREMLKDAWDNWDKNSKHIEIFQYFIVDEYLASRLAEKGEAVAKLFGWWIWGRTTCGQSIYCDLEMREIAEEYYR